MGGRDIRKRISCLLSHKASGDFLGIYGLHQQRSIDLRGPYAGSEKRKTMQADPVQESLDGNLL